VQLFDSDRKPNITGCEARYFDWFYVRVCIKDTLVRHMGVSGNVNVGIIDSDTRMVVFFILDGHERVKEFDRRAEILEAKEFIQGERLQIVYDIPNATDMPMTRQQRSYMSLEILVVEVKSTLPAWYASDLG